jgi:SAM-dependent methyltransferase
VAALVVRLLLAARRRRWYWPVTTALERAGERRGLDWLIYNPLVFAFWHDRAVDSAQLVADALERAFPQARSYADIGAGTGAYAAELQRRHKRVVAYERSRWGRLFAHSQGVDVRGLRLERLRLSSLAQVDVALCFEVAEHLRPDLGDILVRVCTASAPNIVFTAAEPSPGGTGHVNEQPRLYWVDRFEREGVKFDTELTETLRQGFVGAPAGWLSAHVMVFVATRSNWDRPGGRSTEDRQCCPLPDEG